MKNLYVAQTQASTHWMLARVVIACDNKNELELEMRRAKEMRCTQFVPAALRDAELSTECCLVLLGCTSSFLSAALHTDPEEPEEPSLDGVGPISLRRAPTAAEAGLHRRRKHTRSGRAAEWSVLAPIRPLRHHTAWDVSMCRRHKCPPLRLEVLSRISSLPGPSGPPSLPKQARGSAT
jgi:hypothetical protein